MYIKDVFANAVGAVELQGKLFVSNPTPVQTALQHTADK
jgi:hypothetical protein